MTKLLAKLLNKPAKSAASEAEAASQAALVARMNRVLGGTAGQKGQD